MEFDYDKSVSNAHLEAAGWGMDAFNHSNPFESHVIYVRDYRNDHIRLFTIKQADFDTIKLPLHLTSDMLASVIAEFVSKAAKEVEYEGVRHAGSCLGWLCQINRNLPELAESFWSNRAIAYGHQYLCGF